jgi:hypothetical protein
MDMDRRLSSSLRATFFIHALISAVVGAAIWLIPGRTLTALGWVPAQVPLPESAFSVPGSTFVDPVITRILGAALLGLAYASFMGWRARSWAQVGILVQLETLFCILGALAILAGVWLLGRPMPLIGWVFLALFVAFAFGWVIGSRQRA